MAQIERRLTGDFDRIVIEAEAAVMNGSISATKEAESYFVAKDGSSRCCVKVFERYSYFGKNRVSMNLTFYYDGHYTYATAVTSGGSQAMFIKILPIGEETFLNTIRDVFDKFQA